MMKYTLLAMIVLFVLAGYFERRWNVIKKTEALNAPYRLGSGEMFDKVASHFDLTNKVLSVGWHNQWKNVLVRELDVYGTDRVLDLATGTGDVAIGLSHAMKDRGKMLGSTPSIIGIDPSVEMLRVASTKVSRDKDIFSGYISLKVGSVHNLYEMLEKESEEKNEPLEDLKYDKVAISFGVRNFDNYRHGLEHVRRATKNSNLNGKLVILEFMKPSKQGVLGFLEPFVSAYISYAIPMLGTIISDGRWNVYNHLSNSILNFSTPEEFQSTLSAVGFTHCEHKDIFLGVVYMFSCSTYSPPAQPHNSNIDLEESIAGQEPVAHTPRGGSKSRRRSKDGDATEALSDTKESLFNGIEFEL